MRVAIFLLPHSPYGFRAWYFRKRTNLSWHIRMLSVQRLQLVKYKIHDEWDFVDTVTNYMF